MKINKLFHWLYAFLMGLPLLSSLWIGLIWTFNENTQVPTITENVSKEVDFNQLFLPRNVSFGNISITFDDYLCHIDSGGQVSNINGGRLNRISDFIDFKSNHKYYIKFLSDTNVYLYLCVSDNTTYNSMYAMPVASIYNCGTDYKGFLGFNVSNTIVYDYYTYIGVFDLTQMFGFGNEPTVNEFNSWFTDNYYEYTLSKHIVIEDYSTRQVLDSPVNYIWLPSFGGMGWTIQNVFNSMINGMFGLATSYGIGLTIVKLLTYWLCISLIWLIYDVIMYVPLMIHRWLDKGVIS